MELQDNPGPGRVGVDARNGVLCAVVTVAALAAVWPVANLPFNDDWTFAYTVKRLAETGHLLYNGWSSPSVVTQSYWGLLWVRAAGHFSFQVLRFSTAPLAVGAVVLTYLLARRAGLAAGAAVFAALTLALSPLFLPLATSFMTDVPGCFCLLLATYALVRAGDAPGRGPAVGWMAVGVAAAAVGGSSRQIAWIPALAALPYVAWVRRHDRPSAVAAGVAWVVTVASAVAIQHWFERQPYSLPEPPITHDLLEVLRRPGKMASCILGITLTLVWLVLPAGVAVLARPRTRRTTAAAVAVLCGIALAGVVVPGKFLPPWMGNMFTPTGILGHVPLVGWQPTVLPWPVRMAAAVGVYAVVAALVAMAVVPLADPRRAWGAVRDFCLYPAAERTAAQVLLLVAIGYLALLVSRCALDVSYDRHLLSVVPCLTIPLLALALRRPGTADARVPAYAWVVLAVVGLFAVGLTQSELAVARARVRATEVLRAAGVPRTQISGGFEYDAWTELEAVGHVDVPLVGDPRREAWQLSDLTPHVRPTYRVEYQTQPDTVQSRFGTVPYFSLMPPFHRQLSIDRFVAGAANRPGGDTGGHESRE